MYWNWILCLPPSPHSLVDCGSFEWGKRIIFDRLRARNDDPAKLNLLTCKSRRNSFFNLKTKCRSQSLNIFVHTHSHTRRHVFLLRAHNRCGSSPFSATLLIRTRVNAVVCHCRRSFYLHTFVRSAKHTNDNVHTRRNCTINT